MIMKKIGVASAALVLCVGMPLQTIAMASENTQSYTTNKAENKLKTIQQDDGSFSDVTDYFSIVPGANSSVDKNLVTISPKASWQKGGLWSSEENKVNLTKNFHLEANVYMGDDPNSADGIAFVLQNDSRGKMALGGNAGALGIYGNSYIHNALAIEMDTYSNPGDYDYGISGKNHIAITVPTVTKPIHNALSLLENEIFADGSYHSVSFDWNASTKTLSYTYRSYTGSYTVNNLEETFGGDEVIFGFTGSTGVNPTLQQVEITDLQINGISPKMNLSITGKSEPSETVSVRNTIYNATTDATVFTMKYGVDMDPLFDAETVSNIILTRNDGKTYTVSKEDLLNYQVSIPFENPSDTFTLSYDVGIKGDAAPKGTEMKINAVGTVNGVKYTANSEIKLLIPGDKPVITASDTSVKKGKTFDPMAGVTASDTEDGNMTSKITVKANNVDTSKVGTYHVTYSVTDSDDNTTTKTITVTVTSNDAPVIVANDATVKKGSTFNPLDGVTASDTEDGNVTSKVTVKANDVNTSKIGTYHVTYSVTDSDGNTTTKTITVNVTSNDAPTISATDKTLKKGDVFSPLAGVTASDTEDGNVTSKLTVTANDVDTSKVGTYHVTYSVTDSDGNTTTKTITVNVRSNDAPTISATDKSVKKGDTFNPLTGVTANDTEDGNVTSKLTVTANDVNTSKVGTYHVTYAVTDSDGNTTKKTITVMVTSDVAPVILAADTTVKKGKTFDPRSGMTATDSEDGDMTSKVIVTANDVDTSKIGTYHVTYAVTNSDGNTTTKTITVTVTSNDAPVITAKDQSVKKGKTFSPLAGVTATDTEDGNVTSKVSVTANDVDTSKVGTYHVTYSVTDSDGNTTKKTITVTVTSNDVPVIEASDIVQRIHTTYDVKRAVTASDTEDGDLTSKITVTANDVNTEKAGVYHVTYSVTDSDGNTITKTIKVTILTNDVPVITTSDVYLKARDTFNPLDGITANDLEDGDLTASIQIVSNNVNMASEGLYTVVYSVTDSDDNTTTVTRHIYVRTNDKPEIHVSDQTFKAGFAFDPMAIVSASDLEDGDVTKFVKITANDVNPDVAGTYGITYSVTDSDGNTVTKTITVTVLTNEKPVITAADRTVKAHLAFDPMMGISANDLEDGDLSENVKIIANDVNIDVPGDYHITYSVLDSDGNTTEKTITITVLSNDKPVITGQDTSIKAGRTFDPLAGIAASDTEDGDITANIEILSNDVNPDIAGVYHITYSITDSDGNTTEQTYTVTVLTNDKPVIYASDITLAFGEAFDPMAGVTAEDLEDGDITSQIQVISNDVNPNVAGIYHVTYSVTDSDGNETQFTITVLVGAQPIVPVDPITPVAPAVPTTPAKPSPSVHPAPSASPVVPVKVAQPTNAAPTNALPKTGDSDTTSTVLFGGLLAALGALFLRRKK